MAICTKLSSVLIMAPVMAISSVPPPIMRDRISRSRVIKIVTSLTAPSSRFMTVSTKAVMAVRIFSSMLRMASVLLLASPSTSAIALNM